MGAFRCLIIRGLLAVAACLLTILPIGASETGGPKLPAPGSYTLDRIQPVPFGIVLEDSYFPKTLSRYTKGAVTLLAFFYGHCDDPQGCPLAWDAFEKIRQRSKTDPALRAGTRLVFLSFDPAHDTPDALRPFAENYQAPDGAIPWHFLTTYSGLFLAPILEGFGQEIAASPDGGLVINHLLKAFLIDPDGWVREIYTSAYLEPEVLVNDMKTLLMEKRRD